MPASSGTSSVDRLSTRATLSHQHQAQQHQHRVLVAQVQAAHQPGGQTRQQEGHDDRSDERVQRLRDGLQPVALRVQLQPAQQQLVREHAVDRVQRGHRQHALADLAGRAQLRADAADHRGTGRGGQHRAADRQQRANAQQRQAVADGDEAQRGLRRAGGQQRLVFAAASADSRASPLEQQQREREVHHQPQPRIQRAIGEDAVAHRGQHHADHAVADDAGQAQTAVDEFAEQPGGHHRQRGPEQPSGRGARR
ncbi:hypothetical protein Ddc_24278 [Ditylenchus destructor]|nr:hypothetical protein Ddc_24278 [Ditylenchus destructor]